MNQPRAVVTDHGDGIVLSVYDGAHAPMARIALDVLAALYLAADLQQAATLRLAQEARTDRSGGPG